MKLRPAKRRFTVTEFLVAMSLSLLLLSSLIAVLLFPAGALQQAMAMWLLDQQVKIARERILRGLEDRHGLRAAESHTIQIFPGESEQVEWMDFDVDNNAFPTPDLSNDNLECRVLTNPGLELTGRTTPGSGKPIRLGLANIKTEVLQIEQDDRMVTLNGTVSTVVGGKTLYRSFVIRTFLIND